jgi:hypothetical protein
VTRFVRPGHDGGGQWVILVETWYQIRSQPPECASRQKGWPTFSLGTCRKARLWSLALFNHANSRDREALQRAENQPLHEFLELLRKWSKSHIFWERLILKSGTP